MPPFAAVLILSFKKSFVKGLSHSAARPVGLGGVLMLFIVFIYIKLYAIINKRERWSIIDFLNTK